MRRTSTPVNRPASKTVASMLMLLQAIPCAGTGSCSLSFIPVDVTEVVILKGFTKSERREFDGYLFLFVYMYLELKREVWKKLSGAMME